MESQAAGEVEDDLGWSLELMARSIFLARAGLETVIAELRAWAAAFGCVVEERVRRVDLCADFEGWDTREEDAKALVRHPRSTVVSYEQVMATEPAPSSVRTYRSASQKVTGLVLCPGNPLMLRVYDKLAEMRVHVDKTKEELERDIWTENGWSGGNVSRVEFQVRGEAARELFGRSVARLVGGLDALWRYCCEGGGDVKPWVRLVVPDTASRLRRCELDPRWQAVQGVTWASVKQNPMRRLRFRGLATATQAWGTMLTALGQSEQIPAEFLDADACAEAIARGAASPEEARLVVGEIVAQTLAAFAPLMCEAAQWRWAQDAPEAMFQRAQAAHARALMLKEARGNALESNGGGSGGARSGPVSAPSVTGNDALREPSATSRVQGNRDGGGVGSDGRLVLAPSVGASGVEGAIASGPGQAGRPSRNM